MKKIGILLLSLLCGYCTYAQNYNEYLKTAYKHIQAGHYEKAQASYKVYVNMTGQTSDDFENLLKNHKQYIAKQEGFIDLGLPSGTCWAQPSTSLYSYEDAKSLINNTDFSKLYDNPISAYSNWFIGKGVVNTLGNLLVGGSFRRGRPKRGYQGYNATTTLSY